MYAMAGGAWEVAYPDGWMTRSPADTGDPVAWQVQSYVQSGKDEPLKAHEILLHFAAEPLKTYVNDPRTFDALLSGYCTTGVESREPESDVLSCNTVKINGRTWAWLEVRSRLFDKLRGIYAGTIANDTLYEASVAVAPGSAENADLATARSIFKTMVLHSTA